MGRKCIVQKGMEVRLEAVNVIIFMDGVKLSQAKC